MAVMMVVVMTVVVRVLRVGLATMRCTDGARRITARGPVAVIVHDPRQRARQHIADQHGRGDNPAIIISEHRRTSDFADDDYCRRRQTPTASTATRLRIPAFPGLTGSQERNIKTCASGLCPLLRTF